jgi:pimeloyl-ACP methyl ester carboxylesterase
VTEVTTREVEANGLRFAYLEAGEGPLVILLHGFPDNAWTWEFQLRALGNAGYRAVAPFLRGYPPTEIPVDGRYEAPVLANDLASLVCALSDDPAYVVGHDWGAVMAYAAMAFERECVARAVVLAGNHPQLFAGFFSSPELIQLNFHQWFFQLEGYAEAATRADELALIDHLWRFWSPHLDAREHVAQVKRETLAHDGAVEAALAYYRALLRLPASDPKAAEIFFARTRVPTLQIFGADDPIARPFESEDACFVAAHRSVRIGGAGHFVHQERPGPVIDLILAWLENRSTNGRESKKGDRHEQYQRRAPR